MTSFQPVLGLVEVSGEREKGVRGLGNSLKGRIWKLEPCPDGTTGLRQSQAVQGVEGGEEGNLESIEEGASKHGCSSGLDPGQDSPYSPGCAAVAGSVGQRK